MITVWLLPTAAIWSLGQASEPVHPALVQSVAHAEPAITFSAIKLVSAALLGVAGVLGALYAGAQKLVRPWIAEEVGRHAAACILNEGLRDQLHAEQLARETAQAEHRIHFAEMQTRIDEIYRFLVERR